MKLGYFCQHAIIGACKKKKKKLIKIHINQYSLIVIEYDASKLCL